MTRRTLGHYRIGNRPVPKVNGLASKGWEVERTRDGRGRDAGSRHPPGRRRQSPPDSHRT